MPILIFNLRAPVIIVVEESFVVMHGQKRIKKESFDASLEFFRPVKRAVISNDAGEDIIPYAVSGISKTPFCVLFPFRFVRSARIYYEQNPEIRVAILEGKYPGRSAASDDFFVYRTDIEADYEKAGLIAGILDGGKNGLIAVFIDPQQNSHYGSNARDAFLKGINSQYNTPQTMFYSYLEALQSFHTLSCVVLSGTAWEFLERKDGIPVIIFSWLDSALMPNDVAVVFDDSPFAQAAQAVRLIISNEREGSIGSKITVLNPKNISKGILHKIQKIR